MLARGDELLGQQLAQAAGASTPQRRSGHCSAQLNNSSGVERAARSLIVAASTHPGPIAVAVWEALCASMPMTTVIGRSFTGLSDYGVLRRAT